MFDLGVISVKNHQHVNLSDHYSGRSSDYGSYDTRVRRTSENYANFRTWGDQLVTEGNMAKDGDDKSGFYSPPLWRTSPNESPPHRKSNHYRSLSPASKAQAIARGQRELMEMVSRMPESCYELTLKDLVEQQPVMELKQESFREEEVKREKVVKRNEKRKEITKRNESLSRNNEGLLLKMVFPVGFGTKKKKKKNDSVTNNNSSSKVCPKSPIPEGSEIKDVDKEWWKKRFSAQSETDQSSGESSSSNNGSGKSTVSTNSSDSISRSSSRHEKSGGGCFSFIRILKKKSVE